MTNGYRFEFRPYQRRFVRTLTTNHGTWDIREGIILRLTDELGKIGWGEIAPISWFGSETLEQALDFCRQLPREITDEIIFSIPDELPACQFGFESAQEWGETQLIASVLGSEFFSIPNAPCPMPHAQFYSALLPAGEAALNQWETLWEQGYHTFKWKIGVYAIANELEIFESLIDTLPAFTKLRLDANGGLSYEEANLWLRTCDTLKANVELPVEIEFIEQPLPVEQFQQMLELSTSYKTAIAIDESVATLRQLAACYQQGWRGIFVIKPGIVGSPSRLRKFCHQHKIDTVFSSVFETAIGRLAALRLAAELSQNNRAVGFGIDHFFEQEDTWFQSLWNDL
ncbi:mandelate racemase/muconate lactonizing protein [Nostoc commune NIES-4072]|uniref:o-succinylbenzoate synthase n=1 Tax=Nostoc commune NIES-4072 TaxID=2005467 RepID=A0A2R5FT96_NOSCO|nr:o-succinylbenzoate synthase [Nostoc commune]BBD69575.1 mandelate racemase/muconate lactonizing protein [Nostoc commune HK-02]GBG19423.1 mandelate racemase/muconate lactonizing protein [Nostoc commune NIES-4072]